MRKASKKSKFDLNTVEWVFEETIKGFEVEVNKKTWEKLIQTIESEVGNIKLRKVVFKAGIPVSKAIKINFQQISRVPTKSNLKSFTKIAVSTQLVAGSYATGPKIIAINMDGDILGTIYSMVMDQIYSLEDKSDKVELSKLTKGLRTKELEDKLSENLSEVLIEETIHSGQSARFATLAPSLNNPIFVVISTSLLLMIYGLFTRTVWAIALSIISMTSMNIYLGIYIFGNYGGWRIKRIKSWIYERLPFEVHAKKFKEKKEILELNKNLVKVKVSDRSKLDSLIEKYFEILENPFYL